MINLHTSKLVNEKLLRTVFGSECFFPISARERTKGKCMRLPWPVSSLRFFSFWCRWRHKKDSRTLSRRFSSSCFDAIRLSKIMSVRKKDIHHFQLIERCWSKAIHSMGWQFPIKISIDFSRYKYTYKLQCDLVSLELKSRKSHN